MTDPSRTERLARSQIGYSHESDTQSMIESFDNNDYEQLSDTNTKHSVYPESEKTGTTVIQLYNSVSSRPQSFPYQPNTIIDDRLQELALKHEIRQELADRLRALEDYEIIILCDDSSSMKTTVDNTTRTRWEELRDFVKIVLEVGTIFDSSGVDIYFLNRRSIHNVTDPKSVDDVFSAPPYGYTPLVKALRTIFQLSATRRGNDKKVLVFVATDGVPTDDEGNINVDDLEYLMIHERQTGTTHVMFLICTDDPDCVDYLNGWDRRMINVDITDDFKTERDAIRRFHDPQYPFSKGDYIVKALVGAIDSEIDRLNEPRQANAD